MEKQKFIDWSYGKRAQMVKKNYAGEKIDPNEFFLSTTTHNPSLISVGPAGLNASVKGIGWLPKEEYLPELLKRMQAHIATYDKSRAQAYSKEGLRLMVEEFYSHPEKMDFNRFFSVEMAMDYNDSVPERQGTVAHSYVNYSYNSQATAMFYQPPTISFEVRGKMVLHGKRGMKDEEMDLIQKIVNAQHDVYHAPNVARWHRRPVYEFRIEEVYDNSVPMNAFGKKIFSEIDPVTLYGKDD